MVAVHVAEKNVFRNRVFDFRKILVLGKPVHVLFRIADQLERFPFRAFETKLRNDKVFAIPETLLDDYVAIVNKNPLESVSIFALRNAEGFHFSDFRKTE